MPIGFAFSLTNLRCTAGQSRWYRCSQPSFSDANEPTLSSVNKDEIYFGNFRNLLAGPIEKSNLVNTYLIMKWHKMDRFDMIKFFIM